LKINHLATLSETARGGGFFSKTQKVKLKRLRFFPLREKMDATTLFVIERSNRDLLFLFAQLLFLLKLA
jgi:hypothetical protein